MIFLLTIIINMFFILLPNILYIIYVANKQNLNEDVSKTILDISIISSLLLIILLNYIIDNTITVIFIFLIFLVSLKYRRYLTSMLITIISTEFINYFFGFNYLLLLIIFVINIFINYIANKKYNNSINLILLSLSLYLIFNKIKVYLLMILFLYTLYYIINTIINKSSKILELQNILKEYNKETNLKVSLFKITHEIKNPLAVVKGYLSMINIDNKEKSAKYLSIINSEVERTINLLNDFMQFSKIEINKEIFKLDKLLDEVKNILISLTDNKKIYLNFKTEKDITINADYNRLKQVLINVIKNAIEASYVNSNIDITCYLNKNLNIVVKDYGTGMDTEVLNNLFVPFNTTKEKGTGLGVCLSKEIIEAHKGKISYNSVLNKGTIVKIVLPL